jgi:hypothetical protein
VYLLLVWIPPVVALLLKKKSKVTILYWSLATVGFPFGFLATLIRAVVGKREEKAVPAAQSGREAPPKQEAPPPRSEPPSPHQESTNGQRQMAKVVSRSQACQILGIGVTATMAEAKSAYRKGLMDYHPDKVAHLGQDLRVLAEQRTRELNLSFDFLEAFLDPHHEASNGSVSRQGAFKTGAEETSIYPEDSIVDATPDDPNRIFRRGPFEDCDDDCYAYSYVLGLDYAEGMASGKSYISINSWKGRIAYGIEDGSLLGAEILELALRGGWDQEKYYAYHEVSCGGADVIPHYVTIRIAESLRKFLRNAPHTIESECRAIRKNTLLWAVDILAAGPTTFPW